VPDMENNKKYKIYCDVHAVGLRSRRYLVTTKHGTMDVSLESVPRKCLLYVRSQAI
jgi:hypothetical protein